MRSSWICRWSKKTSSLTDLFLFELAWFIRVFFVVVLWCTLRATELNRKFTAQCGGNFMKSFARLLLQHCCCCIIKIYWIRPFYQSVGIFFLLWYLIKSVKDEKTRFDLITLLLNFNVVTDHSFCHYDQEKLNDWSSRLLKYLLSFSISSFS